MRPRPSPAVLSALVTGESLERLRRGLAAGTGNLDSPTESTDQLLAPEGGRGREVLNLEETDLDLLRGGCEGCPSSSPLWAIEEYVDRGFPLFGRAYGLGVFMEDFKEKLLSLTSLLGDLEMWVPLSFLLLSLTC